MGKITILEETTKNPITLIGKRAGICWDADISDVEKNYKRGIDCIKSGHGRTLEYVNVEMIIDGYSAKVLREYYTHIGGAPTRLQASTRYIDYSKGDGFAYTTPPSLTKNSEIETEWHSFMLFINSKIQWFIEHDIPIEDATMALPLAYSSKIVDKRNLRNLMDMSRQRMCNRAYWEYRELFRDICNALREYSDEWKWIVDNLFHAKCDEYGYCSESKSCGRKPQITSKKEIISQNVDNFGVKEAKIDISKHFLNNYGFTFGEHSGPMGEYGFTNIFFHNQNQGLMTLWITVDVINNKLYIHDESESHEFVSNLTIDIPNELLESENKFIEWLYEKDPIRNIVNY